MQFNETHIAHNSSFRRQDIADAIHNMLWYARRAPIKFSSTGKTYYSPFSKNDMPSTSSSPWPLPMLSPMAKQRPFYVHEYSCIIAYHISKCYIECLPWCSKKSHFFGFSSILCTEKLFSTYACNSTGINASIFRHCFDVGIKILARLTEHENGPCIGSDSFVFSHLLWKKKNKIKNVF